jgi:hypothetical protein
VTSASYHHRGDGEDRGGDVGASIERDLPSGFLARQRPEEQPRVVASLIVTRAAVFDSSSDVPAVNVGDARRLSEKMVG